MNFQSKRDSVYFITEGVYHQLAGFTAGFIQLAYPGSIESKGGIGAMINDELKKFKELLDMGAITQ